MFAIYIVSTSSPISTLIQSESVNSQRMKVVELVDIFSMIGGGPRNSSRIKSYGRFPKRRQSINKTPAGAGFSFTKPPSGRAYQLQNSVYASRGGPFISIQNRLFYPNLSLRRIVPIQLTQGLPKGLKDI